MDKNFKLNIYTDDTFTEVKKIVEADKLKVPYRVAVYVITSLDELESDNDAEIMKFCAKNIDKLDKIIKATFGVSEAELECIDGMELVQVALEIYKWVTEKMRNIPEAPGKNLIATA